ncbi:MAG: sigma-70 family RNA polymerase sigma factor [Treponemataceae bacterium]
MEKMIGSSYENEKDSCMALYLREINKIPLLTREEEKELALKAQHGDKKAKDKIINSNLRFVVNIAKQYQGRGLDIMDLISEGNVGLISAIEKFDLSKGYHFISYAVWWIRQSILKAIYEKSKMIRLPLNRVAEVIQIEKTRKTLKGNFSEEEELCRVAQMLGMDKKHVREMILISREMLSLDAKLNLGSEDSNTLCDFIEDNLYESPENFAISQDMNEKVETLLSTLNERESEILRYRYGMKTGESMSLKEVGKIFGLTKERIRQIEKKALTRLQDASVVAELESFVA